MTDLNVVITYNQTSGSPGALHVNVIADPALSALIQTLTSKVDDMSGTVTTLDEMIAQLQATVAAHDAADEQSMALLQSIPGLISAAVAQAQAAGATPAQLASLQAVNDTIAAETAKVQAADAAAAPAPAPAPAPAVDPNAPVAPAVDPNAPAAPAVDPNAPAPAPADPAAPAAP